MHHHKNNGQVQAGILLFLIDQEGLHSMGIHRIEQSDAEIKNEFIYSIYVFIYHMDTVK